MVAYLEKTDGNTEFHQIMDFLTRSSIYYALTVSPIVSTSFVEQFWTTAKSRTVNNISYIDATVAGKPVTISEASIRSDLLFDDADGIDSLNNQAIFDNIQLMGNQLKDVPVPLDTTFSPNPDKKDEGDALERPSDSPPIPSHPHPSEDQPQIQPDPSPRPSPTTHISDSIPEGSGGNHGGQSSNDASLSGNEDGLTLQSVYDLCVSLCKQVTAQAKEIKALKAQVKKLKKGVKPLITHHKAWMKTRLARKTSLKKKGVHKEYVSKQGRKSVKTFKGEPSVHKDPAFDDLDDFVDVDDTLDYMEIEDVQGERRNEGTNKGNEGTDKQDGGIDNTKVSTDRQGEGTADQNEGKSVTQTTPTPTPTTPTPITPTPTVFGDDETIAQALIIMSQNKEKLNEKEKGVEIRNVEETEKPRPTSTRSILTLRPLPKIDPKDKGKKRIEEEDDSDTKSKGITKVEKKFKQLANDEEVARKARINADKILTEEHQKEERDKFTIEQRAKFLHDTIDTQRKFLAQQRKRPRSQPDDDSDDEHRKCLRITTFESTIASEIMETKSFIARLHKVSLPDGNYLVIYIVIRHFRAFNYLMEGDLKIMMESSIEENDQKLKDGTVIYMLVERRYPLSKELLKQMIDLGLEVEKESTAALQLVRFIKQQLNEE
ncbi:hypothetical protein Tco_0452509 [Tanacetum coccineum]